MLYLNPAIFFSQLGPRLICIHESNTISSSLRRDGYPRDALLQHLPARRFHTAARGRAERAVRQQELMERLGGPGRGPVSATASPSPCPPSARAWSRAALGPGRGAPTRHGGTAALRPGHAPAALPAGRLGRAWFSTALGGGRDSVAREPRRGGAGWRRESGSSPALPVTLGRLCLRAAALLLQAPLPRCPRGAGPVSFSSRTPPLLASAALSPRAAGPALLRGAASLLPSPAEEGGGRRPSPTAHAAVPGRGSAAALGG